MITPHEQELIDKLYEIEQDFYAPLLLLVVSRTIARLQDKDFMDKMDDQDVLDIVTEAYKDMNQMSRE